MITKGRLSCGDQAIITLTREGFSHPIYCYTADLSRFFYRVIIFYDANPSPTSACQEMRLVRYRTDYRFMFSDPDELFYIFFVVVMEEDKNAKKGNGYYSIRCRNK